MGGISLRRFSLLFALIIQIFLKRAFGSLVRILSEIFSATIGWGFPFLSFWGFLITWLAFSGQEFLILSMRVSWWRDVWCHFIPPSWSALTWRLLLNRLPTEDRLCRVGFHLASRCSVCGVSSESSDHIFLQCPLVATLWEAVFSAFQRRVSADS
ncbi:hypothetical protein Dsin_001395 [Dipteronia sinensis]|uniref:Reverse transcriptase zinc-binding domain-containing protein n=1 Tax=Dipteronia sinensis TaxID=43782 RepID=A0AAE0B5A8_9ROSI|nr:hypothetical protein Dsin_001395 [Dipteronia sinensis]